ncbi:hypothetical protein GCM10027062_39120 [Nocardioides hungaricus]
MIDGPWSVVLVVAFAITGGYCLVELLRRRDAHSGMQVVHVNHLLMSIAMIVMVFVAELGDLLTWTQVGVFAVLILALLVPWAPKTRVERVDAAAYGVLNAAMIWMLLAMPQLMADMSMPDMSGMSDRSGGSMPGMEMPGDGMAAMSAGTTPGWVDAVNAGAVGLAVVCGLWWLWRAVGVRSRVGHALCDTLMAAGMAVMLVLMN